MDTNCRKEKGTTDCTDDTDFTRLRPAVAGLRRGGRMIAKTENRTEGNEDHEGLKTLLQPLFPSLPSVKFPSTIAPDF